MKNDPKNRARDDAGVTVTLVRRDETRTTTVTRGGLVGEALRELLEGFDAAVWRVQSFSTPRTILADLHYRRMPNRTWGGLSTPEQSALTMFGKGEYL